MEALVELVDDEMPRALVAAEMERRQEVLVHRLGHQGVQLEQYLQLTGTSPDQFFAQLEQQSIAAIKADLALRYVAEAEGVEVTDDDVAQEIATMAERQGVDEARIRKALESEDRLPEVLSGIRKSKALEWLIEHTEYVDEDGRVIERSELEPPSLQSPDRGPEREEGQQEQETPE
ncbi:MAG TPA: hypothetical protein VG078_09730, partial [Acidimicrobiales bacterium]|nr:hypothetical protein [Acidimicrobiales bacterium]